MDTSAANIHAKDVVARCERNHAAGVLALATAEAGLDSAVQAYAASLGQGRDAARTARHLQTDAEVDRDIARDAVDRLAGQLHEARIRARDAEREHLKAEAFASANAFGTMAPRLMKAITTAARSLARALAEAELKRDAARDGGVTEADLPIVEGFRDVPGWPKEIIETKRVTRWIHPHTREPLDDAQSKLVIVRNGQSYTDGGNNAWRLSDQRSYDRVVYFDHQRPVHAESLITALKVPGLMADDAPGWSEPEAWGAEGVLAHLAVLEGRPLPERSDRRERRIELVPVLDAELDPDLGHTDRESVS